MEERVKNIKTTVIGAIVIVMAVLGLIFKWFDYVAFGSLMGLGYSFVMAKDTLLEGITQGVWRAKE